MSHSLVPVLAFLGPETWIILVVAGGVLIFGADKLPKLARSAGHEAQAATAAGTSETSAAPAPGTSGTTTAHPL